MTQQLTTFDARVVQTPLQGLLRNVDSELARKVQQAMSSRNPTEERKLSLLLTMLRITKNCYDAASFLCSDADDAPKRKREFALILPPTNRQILDLLFTLVFMLDDFPTRSMSYELSGYRQAREIYDKFYGRHGTDPKWQAHFAELHQLRRNMERYLPITPAQIANPAVIPYWRAPYRLMQQPTQSQPFLEFLEEWLYGETSAQAHLNAAGLFALGGYVITDFAPEEQLKAIERNFESFKFRHFCRLLITVLAIASELDTFCQLNNRQMLRHLWVLLGGYSSEATDVYNMRYQAMLA